MGSPLHLFSRVTLKIMDQEFHQTKHSSTEIFASIGFRKKSVLEFPEFSIWKELFTFLQKNLSMLG